MGVPDFAGWATKNDLLCSDGRTIRDGAFAHQSGTKVPLVWQHQHNEPSNVLGYAILEDQPGGVRAQAFFNGTPAGLNAKMLVEHGDVESLSIWANGLVQKGKDVMKGMIKEVSLVLSGANPGAFIDQVNLAHADGSAAEDGEAVIFVGDAEIVHDNLEEIELPEEIAGAAGTNEGEEVPTAQQPDLVHADGTAVLSKDETIKDVLDSFTPKQAEVVQYIVGDAIQQTTDELTNASAAAHSEDSKPEDLLHSYQEGFEMGRNLFTDAQAAANASNERPHKELSHDDLAVILGDSKYAKMSDQFMAHAEEYGIENIDYLFPDARTLSNSPEILSRRMEWVQGVLDGTKHSPFSRIKSIVADLTADEARAKGYVKGTLKKEEILKLLRRVTTPTTIYKKQKLDRDDIIDIVDIDVLAWLKAEMRVMLDEEIARAILVGDNRDADDQDKIDEDHLRPIAWDDDMYAPKVNLLADSTPAQTNEAIVRAQSQYKGSGNPTMYTTQSVLTDLILDKDTTGRRFYATKVELAAALGVKDIVVVEAMEDNPEIVAIVVNLTDYTVGADKGGEISFFDDFDIDWNQQKYLIETRISGALTKPMSALIIKRAAGTVVTPSSPTYNGGTHVITIPSVTGVIYSIDGVDVSSGAQPALEAGDHVEVEARPANHYSFPHTADKFWTISY